MPPPASLAWPVVFLKSFLAPWGIPKHQRRTFLGMDPQQSLRRWQWLPWATKCLCGGRSWAQGEKEPPEEGLPEDKEHHCFHDTYAQSLSYLGNCSFHLGTWVPVAMKRWLGFCRRVYHCALLGYGGSLQFGSGTQVIVTPSKYFFSHFCGLVCLWTIQSSFPPPLLQFPARHWCNTISGSNYTAHLTIKMVKFILKNNFDWFHLMLPTAKRN